MRVYEREGERERESACVLVQERGRVSVCICPLVEPQYSVYCIFV